MEPKEDEQYLVIKQFSTKIEDTGGTSRVDQIRKLLQTVPLILAKYPDNPIVLENICKTITLASLYIDESAVIDTNGFGFVTTYLATLSSLDWKSQPVTLVHAANESIGKLFIIFSNVDMIPLVSSFFNKVLDSSKYEYLSSSLIAAGGAFPHDLPNNVLKQLNVDGVHTKLRELVAIYIAISENDMVNILTALQSFVEVEPTSATEYIFESTHFILLFAAQHFFNASQVQKVLWGFLSKLIKHSTQFGAELNSQVLIPAVSTMIKDQVENSISTVPVVRFIIDYISDVPANPPFVVSCYEVYQDFLPLLLPRLDDSRELLTKEEKDEVEAISELMIFFCMEFKGTSTVNGILNSRIVPLLGLAAVKWPLLCCQSYCKALDAFLGHIPPDPSTLPVLLRNMMNETSPELQMAKVQFLSENHLLTFEKLLNSPATFQLPEARLAMYVGMKQLLKYASTDITTSWLTKEFLEAFILALPQDISRYFNKMHVFVFTAHYITYTITPNEMQILYDLKWHEVAVNDCLKLASTREARTACFGFVNCLFHSYRQFLKDISVFATGDFSSLLVQIAKKYGFGSKSEAGQNFGSMILNLTADKKASNLLYEKGFLDELYPFVDDKYDPIIVRGSIHAIGNIALAGHHVKQEVLSHDFHMTLITFLDRNMTTADPNVLSACCRVLHILASGDWAKRQFAENGLVSILLRMLETRRDNAEISWRPLGLLSSLGFMSLSNREYIITEKVLKAVHRVLKRTEDPKVTSYTALVFLASVDIDRRSADLMSLRITETFQQVLQNESMISSNSDLKRWGTSLVEKGQLFTIPIGGNKLKKEEEELLASCMEQSITWPEAPHPDLPNLPAEDTDSDKIVNLLPLEDEYLSPKFPEAPELTDTAKTQMKDLGLDPKCLFRIGRFFGNSHGLCSNCEKDGRSEEIVFRPQSLSPHQYQLLIDRGWYRRGGVKMFRYRYNHNLDCSDWETRVLLSEFDHRKHKSYKKVLRRMPEDRLTVETIPTQFVQEAYDLYNTYHLKKHDKPRKSEYSYCEHIVNSPLRNQSIDGFQYGTFHQLYRLDGKLVAVGVFDVVPNGIVSIYMWYGMDKEVTKLSFGVYSALKEIEFAKKLSECNPNIKYYYLQGWNGNNHKLSYKANYEPEEFYSPCTVLDWVSGLEGVKKAQDDFKACRKGVQYQPENIASGPPLEDMNGSNSEVKKKDFVSGDAMSLDRIRYQAKTALDGVDVSTIIVCLNHQIYLYFGQMLEIYPLSSDQKQLMIERFEELLLALGPELASNMVIDLVACPMTGELNL